MIETPAPPRTARWTPSGWPAAWRAAPIANAPLHPRQHLPLRTRPGTPWRRTRHPRPAFRGAKSSAASASAMIRRWSVAAWPVVFGAMSDSTRSALPPSTATSRAGIVRVGEIALQQHRARRPDRSAAGPPRPPRAAPRCSATCVQPPGAAPRSTTRAPRRISRNRSSSSISLNAARERQPCCLRRRHIRVVQLPRAASAARRRCGLRAVRTGTARPRGSSRALAAARGHADRRDPVRRAPRGPSPASCAAACPRAGRGRPRSLAAPATAG